MIMIRTSFLPQQLCKKYPSMIKETAMILTLMQNEGIENETSEERINQPVIEIQPHQTLLMNKELIKMIFARSLLYSSW